MEFECTFQIVTYTFNNGFSNKNVSGYTCRVHKITFKPELRAIRIIGSHQEGLTNEDVLGVSVNNIKFISGRIPRGLTQHFPNLTYLQFNKCGLRRLVKDDLTEFGQLRGMWLPDNELESLDNNVFENSPGIRQLSFYGNRLKFVGGQVLKPLKHLTDANFQLNTCINAIYQNGNKQQLDALIENIIKNCQPQSVVSDQNGSILEMIDMKRQIKSLSEQNEMLLKRIANLEAQHGSCANNASRIDILEQLLSEMQVRLASMEGFQ